METEVSVDSAMETESLQDKPAANKEEKKMDVILEKAASNVCVILSDSEDEGVEKKGCQETKSIKCEAKDALNKNTQKPVLLQGEKCVGKYPETECIKEDGNAQTPTSQAVSSESEKDIQAKGSSTQSNNLQPESNPVPIEIDEDIQLSEQVSLIVPENEKQEHPEAPIKIDEKIIEKQEPEPMEISEVTDHAQPGPPQNSPKVKVIENIIIQPNPVCQSKTQAIDLDEIQEFIDLVETGEYDNFKMQSEPTSEKRPLAMSDIDYDEEERLLNPVEDLENETAENQSTKFHESEAAEEQPLSIPESEIVEEQLTSNADNEVGEEQPLSIPESEIVEEPLKSNADNDAGEEQPLSIPESEIVEEQITSNADNEVGEEQPLSIPESDNAEQTVPIENENIREQRNTEEADTPTGNITDPPPETSIENQVESTVTESSISDQPDSHQRKVSYESVKSKAKGNVRPESIPTMDFIPLLSDDEEEVTSSTTKEPEEDGEPSFLRVHDVPFQENNANETENVDQTASITDFEKNIQESNQSKAENETVLQIDVPSQDVTEVISIDDDEDEEAVSSTKLASPMFSEEKNRKETQNNPNEISPDPESDGTKADSDDVVIVSKEIPVVVLDSDSDEDGKKEAIKTNAFPLAERQNSRRHLPPIAVDTRSGVKTDFTVTRTKPVKTKLVIQRDLGDVLLDPEEIKRAQKEKMREFIRLKDIEREINNQRFRRRQSPSKDKQPQDLLLNPFALKSPAKEPESRRSDRSSSREKYGYSNEKSNKKEQPIKSFDLTDDNRPSVTVESIAKHLYVIRESVTAAKKNPTNKSNPISSTNPPNDTKTPTVKPPYRKTRFSSPIKKSFVEPPKFNTISVFDVINDVTREMRSSRSPHRRNQRLPSPKRASGNGERFGDRASTRNSRLSPPRHARGARKRSPSPRTEYEMAAKRIERNLRENDRGHNSRGDVDFRDMRFSVRNDLSAQERQNLVERELLERRGSIFNRLGGSSREPPPPSPPRGAFRDDFLPRNSRMDDVNMRDFPRREDYPRSRDNFPMIGGNRDDSRMQHEDFSSRNRFDDRGDFPQRGGNDRDLRDLDFPPRSNDFGNPNIRDRFDVSSRQDFDGRIPRRNSMFTVSNPRNVDHFVVPSPPRIVPPPDYDLDERSNQNARASVFNRLQASNRVHINDRTEGYWEQGGDPAPNRTPSPPPPPIYNPEEHYESGQKREYNNFSEHFPQNSQQIDWENNPIQKPPNTMIVDVRQPVTSSVLNFEEEDFLVMISCEKDNAFLTSQNCSQILDHLEMLNNTEFRYTAYKDDCLFIKTTRTRGEWIIQVVKSSNLRFCPKLTAEVCLGALPSSEPHQVCIKIISSVMNTPLTSANFYHVVETIQAFLGQHPRWCRVVNTNNITFYKNSINIDCHKDLDMAKHLKDIIATVRVENNNCPKLAVFIDGDYVDMTMTLDAQLNKVGTIMNAIRFACPDLRLNNWIIVSVNFTTRVFLLKVPLSDAPLLCRERLVLNIKWNQNCRGRLLFEFLDKRIEKNILNNMRR